jgi:hypothetical protein
MTKHEWTRATLGSVSGAGDPIIVWCNNRACAYWIAHDAQYRGVLTVADLAALAEKYGADLTFVDFRARLRCRHCGSGDVSTIGDRTYETPLERWERTGR